MQPPLIPDDETRRLKALHRLELLDTPAEERFDRITRIAQHHFGVRIALVSLVDATRQWFKSRQGLDTCETGRDISLCGHAILADDVFIIPNALQDPRFADNPLVTGPPAIRFYAGAPLHAHDGSHVGTLCLIDPKPRRLSTPDLAVLRDLAAIVDAELDRTRLLHDQAELAAKDRELQELIQLSPGVVYRCEAAGAYAATYISPQVERMLGYPPQDFTRNPSFWLDHVHPDDRPAMLLDLQRLRQRREHSHEYRFRHADGHYRWMHDKLQLLLDAQGEPAGIVGMWMDITARKQAEEALRSSEARIRAVVDTALDSIISIDSRGIIQTANPATERVFGYARHEMLGSKVNMLMPEPYCSAHDGYMHNYLTTGHKKIIGIGREVSGRRKDGSTFPMELAVTEMRVAGERMFTGIVRDLSEHKKVERLKNEFVSTVSHELRTPLTSIRGALGLVIGRFSHELPDKVRQMLEMAERNSERLTLLINDLLDLDRIESGRLAFEFRPEDLVALARRALDDNEGYARRHGVLLQLQTGLAAAPVHADALRLLQVLANLISNAVKYSPAEGSVELKVERFGEGFRLSVRDHGPGIPPEFRSRVFQRFAQADSSDTRAKGGSGLGLSITKAIVERHGGRIDYRSEPGQGTTFHVELPARPALRPDDAPAGASARALICEDNADVAHILSQMLALEGMESDLAGSAEEARALLASRSYGLMLLDLSLPDADGLDLLPELRATPATSQLPVIVVSGRARLGEQAFAGEALAVADWLQKPLQPHQLQRAVRSALHRQGRPRILHVEDDPDIVQVAQALLEDMADYTHADTLSGARQRLGAQAYDLVLLDLGLADGSGADLLDDLKGRCPVVIFSARPPDRVAHQQVRAALTKSHTSNEQLRATIRRVLATRGGSNG